MISGQQVVYTENNKMYVPCYACSTVMQSVINKNVLVCPKCRGNQDVLMPDRRKHHRKEVSISARGFSARVGAFDVRINNISGGGFRIFTEDVDFKVGEFTQITTLLAEKKVTVCVQIMNKNNQNTFGCAFLIKYSSSDAIKVIEKWLEFK